MNTNTILLIDADGDCEAVVTEVAKRIGCALQLRKTSRDAFAILRNSVHPSLVVVDVDPGAHGLALLEAISVCGSPAGSGPDLPGGNLHEADRCRAWRRSLSRKAGRVVAPPLCAAYCLAARVHLRSLGKPRSGNDGGTREFTPLPPWHRGKTEPGVLKGLSLGPQALCHAALFLSLGWLAVGSSLPGESASEIARGPRGKSEIALTFDAGAEADCFDDLIAALERAHVHSTFFITGKWAQENPECAATIRRRAHEVGNHTWHHFDLTRQCDEVVREEIVRGEALLKEKTGENPRPRFRAPYGERNERVLRIASELGYRSIYWTIDSLDSVAPEKSPLFLIDRITRRSDRELDGAIILMHVGVRSTAEALPAMIANLQGRGFRLVTVSQLLR